MAWTAPRTWVTNEIVTAAMMNTHVRDNLLQAAAAKMTAAGDLLYSTAANAPARLASLAAPGHLVAGATAPAWRTVDAALGIGSESTALGTGWTGLGVGETGDGPDTVVTVTTGANALLMFWARGSVATLGTAYHIGYAISGATTLAANVNRAVYERPSTVNYTSQPGAVVLQTGLTAGSNTFTLQGIATIAADASISRGYLAVIPF